MEAKTGFKDKNITIYIGDDNKFTLPLSQSKGNIGNMINFIIYGVMNAGVPWTSVYEELANFIHHKIRDIEFEHDNDFSPMDDENKMMIFEQDERSQNND